jgi:septum formation protein
MSKRIILASQSPRRKQLLDQLGLEYDVIFSNIEEIVPPTVNGNTSPSQIVTELARQKAFAVCERLQKNKNANEELVIIAADTIVVMNNKIYGKPNSPSEAKNILQELCGKIHQVYTGVAILCLDLAKSSIQCLTEAENSIVSFRKFSDSEINAYIATGEPMDKAGAYALQGAGACLVAKIEGCYTNVIGLPMPIVVKMLRAVGVEVLGEG